MNEKLNQIKYNANFILTSEPLLSFEGSVCLYEKILDIYENIYNEKNLRS